MLPSDSAQKPIVQVPSRLRTVGRVLAVLVDMLAVGTLTLFYDSAVAAICFGIEFLHYSKANTQILAATKRVLVAGLVIGVLAIIGLLLNRKYFRALATLLGLLPLIWVAYMV